MPMPNARKANALTGESKIPYSELTPYKSQISAKSATPIKTRLKTCVSKIRREFATNPSVSPNRTMQYAVDPSSPSTIGMPEVVVLNNLWSKLKSQPNRYSATDSRPIRRIANVQIWATRRRRFPPYSSFTIKSATPASMRHKAAPVSVVARPGSIVIRNGMPSAQPSNITLAITITMTLNVRDTPFALVARRPISMLTKFTSTLPQYIGRPAPDSIVILMGLQPKYWLAFIVRHLPSQKEAWYNFGIYQTRS